MAAQSEIHHDAHHHTLTLVATGPAKFKCDGCLEDGTGGDRYTCLQRPCVFNLHKDCALAQPTLEHPLLPKSTFVLSFEPPRTKHKQLCSACYGYVQGLHYHCRRKDLYLHPCCAKLPLEIRMEELTFELRHKVSRCCTNCKKGGGIVDSWFYRSTCKKEYLHVRCLKEAFLQSSGTASDVREVDEPALPAGINSERTLKIIEIVMRIIAVITGGPPVIAELLPAVIRLLHDSTE